MPNVFGLILALSKYKAKERQIKNLPEKQAKEQAKMLQEDKLAKEERVQEVNSNWKIKGFRSPDDYAVFLDNQDKIELSQLKLKYNITKTSKILDNLYTKKTLENLYYKKEPKSVTIVPINNVEDYLKSINWKGTKEEFETYVKQVNVQEHPEIVGQFSNYLKLSQLENTNHALAATPNGLMAVAMAVPAKTEGKKEEKKKEKYSRTVGLGAVALFFGAFDYFMVQQAMASKAISNKVVDAGVLQEILNSDEYKNAVADLRADTEAQVANIQSLTEEQVALLNDQILDIVASADNADIIAQLQTSVTDLQSQIDTIDSYYDKLISEQATNVEDLKDSVGFRGTNDEFVTWVNTRIENGDHSQEIAKLWENYQNAIQADNDIISQYTREKNSEYNYWVLKSDLEDAQSDLTQELAKIDNNQIDTLQEQVNQLYENSDIQQADAYTDLQGNIDHLTDSLLDAAGQSIDEASAGQLLSNSTVLTCTACSAVAIGLAVYCAYKTYKNNKQVKEDKQVKKEEQEKEDKKTQKTTDYSSAKDDVQTTKTSSDDFKF